MKTTELRTRISLKNILYASDFSPVAENAAPYALALARRYGSKVFAVHVRPLEIYGMAPPESWPVLREASEALAKEQAAQLNRSFAGVEHEAIVEEGDVWDSVSAHVERDHIDLIVMGTHGRKGLEKLLLGSVAEKVLRRAHCPVLTVSPRVHVTPERAIGMKRILFATDFSPSSQIAAAYAVSLAQENQAHLDIVHVIEPQKPDELVHSSELVGGCQRRMRALVPPEAELWCEPNPIVEVGEPVDQILNVAKAHRAELIVLGVRSASTVPAVTHIPWATAHKIIAAAECPVLTVHG